MDSQICVQENPGFEDIVAILECNNCFSDGVQTVTGCTFGNNALIYRDVGKTAFTLARRRDGTAVRIALQANFVENFRNRIPEEADLLFRKIVQEHQEATPEEHARLNALWTEASFRQLELPEEEVFMSFCKVEIEDGPNHYEAIGQRAEASPSRF